MLNLNDIGFKIMNIDNEANFIHYSSSSGSDFGFIKLYSSTCK